MHLHISAICGSFMGGIAQLARELGHKVTGSDANVYPPMSDQLLRVGVELVEGYSAINLQPAPDLVVIGNALSRGNPEVEAILDQGLRYISGPQWLAENVLFDRWVLAVAGTHGKTTGSSVLAWLLEDAGLNPGFLIGGVPGNFDCSARLGADPFFVVEADEYDTAFFDKRSKFVHYHPRTLILNNLEFDHADIFADIEAIKTQFHHLIRTVPSTGLIVVNGEDKNLRDTLSQGCWSKTENFTVQASDNGYGDNWSVNTVDEDIGSEFDCVVPEGSRLPVSWEMNGRHNLLNALGALAGARHAGVPMKFAVDSLSRFKGIKRRMELIALESGVCVYDDFAHHPTAIKTTLLGLRARVKSQKIYAVLEMRSNTMRMGYHKENVQKALKTADFAVIFIPDYNELKELIESVQAQQSDSLVIMNSVDKIVDRLRQLVDENEHIVIMSNGSFQGLHKKVIDMLLER